MRDARCGQKTVVEKLPVAPLPLVDSVARSVRALRSTTAAAVKHRHRLRLRRMSSFSVEGDGIDSKGDMLATTIAATDEPEKKRVKRSRAIQTCTLLYSTYVHRTDTTCG